MLFGSCHHYEHLHPCGSFFQPAEFYADAGSCCSSDNRQKTLSAPRDRVTN